MSDGSNNPDRINTPRVPPPNDVPAPQDKAPSWFRRAATRVVDKANSLVSRQQTQVTEAGEPARTALAGLIPSTWIKHNKTRRSSCSQT